MKKILGIIFGVILLGFFFVEVQAVLAHEGDHTNPVSGPVTSPTCKPGFGFGDKNHCHIKQDNDDKGGHDQDDKHENENHTSDHGHH